MESRLIETILSENTALCNRSISHTGENFHLFNSKGLDDYPFTTPPDLTVADSATGVYPVSVDLKSSKKISTLKELYNFGNDYLSLLKAGVVASGIVPSCFEGKPIKLERYTLQASE